MVAKRKTAAFALLVSLFLLFPVSNRLAGAAEVNPREMIKDAVSLFVSSPVSFAYGKQTQVDSSDWQIVPYEKDEQAMVPVRFVAQSLGAKVGWDPKSRKVTVTLGGKQVTMSNGSTALATGRQVYQTAVPVENVQGRTFVQVGPFVEALGKKLFYDNGLIVISDRENIIDPASDPRIVHNIIMLFNTQYNSSPVDDVIDTTLTSEDPAIQTILQYFDSINEQNFIRYKTTVTLRSRSAMPADWKTIYRVKVVNIGESKATVTKEDYLSSTYGRVANPLEVRIFSVSWQIHRERETMGVGYFTEPTLNFVVIKQTADSPWLIDFVGNSI